jgi:hypothetical protein
MPCRFFFVKKSRLFALSVNQSSFLNANDIQIKAVVCHIKQGANVCQWIQSVF